MFIILLKFAVRRFRNTLSLSKISLKMASGNKSFYHCVVRIIAYDLFSDILKMCIKKSRGNFRRGGSSLQIFKLEEGIYKS